MSFIQLQKNRRKDGRQFTYVHLASSVWRGKKRTPKQERIYLGRLDESGREIIISKGFPSRFQEKVPLDEMRKMVAEGKDVLAWLHAPPVREGASCADIPARVETVGDAHVLLELAKESGLDALLPAAFGQNDGLSLLSLAFQQVVEGRPLYLAGHWIEERSLPDKMKGSGVAVPEVYSLMGRIGGNVDGRESFFRSWIERLGYPECVICDTTSISTYSENLESAEFGYNRDEEDLPQVNLSLVLDKNGTPVWCRTTPGSIPDVSTLRLNCQMLDELGLKAFSTSLDRGFYSRANILEMLHGGMGFTIGVPFSVSQAKSLVRKHKTALNSAKRS
ncbi:MAG: transposase, partial [Candidatus Bathyarchaeota archaeon]|nr:transposase [Candidatus Bathyarchaeota archaeon]